MNVITVDFESYWSQTYTLSKMSPLEYVMGDEYETISCAIKINDGKAEVLFGHAAITARFAQLDIKNSALLAHNMSGFDAYICTYKFRLQPKVWLDTAAMARPLHAKTIGVSLAKLVQHYGIGVKNNAVLMQTRGRHLADFTKAEIEDMRTYNGEDADQCYALFKILQPTTPARELWQIDLITRMRTEPAFVLDKHLLEDTLVKEQAAKREMLREVARMLSGVTPDIENQFTDDQLLEHARSELASQPKFAALLEARGVEVPMKASKTNPDKQVPALAKSDEEFIALQEHDDPIVATAARARLMVKSTLLETRIAKIITAADLAGGRLPVPIRYAGADTSGRDSGEEYNMLNFPRINKKKPKLTDALRYSLTTPPGYKIVVADQSNIELRVNHTLWGVKSSMALWAADPRADLYKASAARRYGISEADIDDKDPRRQQAKVENLGLGFGAGAKTFRTVAKSMSGGEINLSLTEAQQSVDAWRADYPEIVQGWDKCDDALIAIHNGEQMQVDPWGLVHTTPDGLQLPGYLIRYPKLRREKTLRNGRMRWQWVYAEGRHKAGIYGSKADENIVQSLARHTIVDNTIQVFKRTGFRPALRPYDELVYVVPEDKADELLRVVLEVMRTPPTWWPQLTVWAEGSIASTYGAAK